MKKWSIAMIALVFTAGGLQAQSTSKSVPSQKDLKNNTANQAHKQAEIRTDQGVPFSAKGVYGAGKTSASTSGSQASATQSSGNQQTKATVKKKSTKKTSKKKTVKNPGIDNNNGH